MAYEQYTSPTPSSWVTLGGTKRDGKKNPSKIEGFYLGSTTGKDNFNPGQEKTTIVLQTNEGVVGVNCSKGLKNTLADAESQFLLRHGREAKGASMLITFVGLKNTGKGNPMKVYTLQLDKDNTIEVTSVVASAEENDDLDEVLGDDEEAEEVDEVPETLVAKKQQTTRRLAADVLNSRKK